MKCPNCDGTGKAEIGVGAFTIHGADCDQCNGKGIIEPMTEQEYIQSCNTEQLAEFLACVEARQNTDYNEETKAWVEWLKQPHAL